jgi:hypothetical protein
MSTVFQRVWMDVAHAECERADRAEAVLREALAWLENAPIDYSNGVEHYGLDEGRVRGDKIHDALVAKIKQVLERVSS